MPKLQLSYPDILSTIGGYRVTERTESRAVLAWFLANYYRLDDGQIDDCICDGPFDKGIDGLYINEQLAQIEVFQCRLVQTDKTAGDSGIRDFVGTLSQLRSADTVHALQESTKNAELAAILRDQDVATKVAEGYEVRGVFVTNVERDRNAIDFLAIHPQVTLYDRGELERSYVPIDKTPPMDGTITFDISTVPHLKYPIGTEMNMVMVPLLAEELLRMDGISSGELFAWNVRQWLGKKTKVNKDIEKSIQERAEHKYFPAFHNGLTVLCKELQSDDTHITISGYAVVNGCQSLTALDRNRASVSSELRILTKFILVSPDSALASKITNNTNNQNGTTHRDLQSNNPIQTRLQTEVHNTYPGEIFYRIKRGEHLEWDDSRVIENELAAKILLAFDVRDPSSCHQSYKLFDELHGSIFGRPNVTARRIVATHDIYRCVMDKLALLSNGLFANYSLTRYVILYLLREALETDSTGKVMCANPGEFIDTEAKRARFNNCINSTVTALVRFVDNEYKRRVANDGAFDYKRQLKSPKAIQDLRSTIIGQYQVVVDSGYLPKFCDEWNKA